MITSDDPFNNETLSDNPSQHKPWKFCNEKSMKHNYQNLNENREQKINQPMPQYYALDKINSPHLENINSSQLDKKDQKSLNMSHDNSIDTKNYACRNTKEQNYLDQDQFTETILQNSENEIQNTHDTQEIVLDNGEKITIDELKKGYCRREEFISNQEKISEQKGDLQNKARIIAQSADALAQMISTHIPAEPNPLLAKTDPDNYHYMVNLRQKALDIIDHFVEVGRYPNHIATEYEDESLAKKLESENEKLENIFPQTKDPAQRESFFQNIFAIGNKFGFQEEEMKNVVDHRLLALAYYAQLGVKSQKISNDVYNKTVRKPAVTISSKGKKYHNQHQTKSQEQAIRKLHKTGSLYDALEVDFI